MFNMDWEVFHHRSDTWNTLSPSVINVGKEPAGTWQISGPCLKRHDFHLHCFTKNVGLWLQPNYKQGWERKQLLGDQ